MTSKPFRNTKYHEPFVGILRSVLDSPALINLSPHAIKLLIDVAAQYKGDNNGNLTAAWSLMVKRGWRSKTTLWRSKLELIEAGFFHVTRKGRMPNTCELLALTWFPLDMSPKFDPEALCTFKARAYMEKTPLPMPKIAQKLDWTLPNGGRPANKKCNP